MRTLRIGLVGASGFARVNHCASLKRFEGVELAAIAEPVAALREETAREFGVARQYPTHREMIDAETLDAVYVVMGPHRSFGVLNDCISRGLATFMEKPAVVDSDSARALARVAETSGALTMVGFNRRFIPVLVEIKRRVRAKGPLTRVTSRYFKRKPNPVYYDDAIDFLRCDGIHAVDTLRWLAEDEATEVAGCATQAAGARFNSFCGVVRFAGGGAGILDVNFASARREHTFELHTPDCAAFIDPDGQSRVVGPGKGEEEIIDTRTFAGSDDPRVYYGFEAENRHFIDCVRAGRRPSCDIVEAVRTHELIDRLMASGMGACT